MTTNTETSVSPSPPPLTRLSNITYAGQEIRRVSFHDVEMIALKDVLTACGYSSTKNCTLYYGRVDCDQTERLKHLEDRSPMIFATATGVLQMVGRMRKEEAYAFSHWFKAYAGTGDPQAIPDVCADKSRLRETLTALKMDILVQAQSLHEMRVEAATIEAALNSHS